MTSLMTGPGDIRDQHWLDERIEAIESGVEAVVDIARNWTDGRCVARLHPGVSAAEYVTSRVGVLGKAVVPVLLAQSDWSNRQIAAVAGVDHTTVGRIAARTGAFAPVDRPTETLGADGKYRPAHVVREVVAQVIEPIGQVSGTEGTGVPQVEGGAIDGALWDGLLACMDALDRLAESDAPGVAVAVPGRRRAATAKRLRKLGSFLGRVAWSLEREDGQQ